MPLPSITLAEFNKIASGQQNAGQVDFETNSNGEFTGGLVKINNHIIRKRLNGVHLTGERVVAIKEAFLDALQKANVRAEDLQTIRAELGMSGELDAGVDANAALLDKRYTPLTREIDALKKELARKNFLVEMLHLYHGHEKGFDKGTNYHGRTHATRTFVLSTAMANILREKGVALDMNAVALVTAGHDTGRTANGEDTEHSETRSAENVNAAVDRLYPGAAGDAWKAQVKTNVTSKGVEQTTIEGHVFKSADSLDYFRVGTLDRNRFLFLRDDLVTENGVVVAADPVVREQLIKEAERLTMLTAPSYRLRERWINVSSEVLNAATDAEAELKAREKRRIEEEMARLETAQTETLSDQQIVELVEKSIRDNPQDFPLLTKYYLNAA